jgi:phospholipase/lecithinase/hemolysin
MAAAIRPDQWVFVDRIHFTDAGHDFVSKLLLSATQTKAT